MSCHLISLNQIRYRTTPEIISSSVTKHHHRQSSLTTTPFQTYQDCLMCCALRQYPVTGFMSDHPFSAMCDRGSSPHQRREENFPLRTALPSRESSKEDIELAQRLIGHSQVARTNEQTAKDDSPSPTYELQSPGSKSPSSDRMHQFTPRSLSVERSQRESSQTYSSATPPPPHSVPSGQVCR